MEEKLIRLSQYGGCWRADIDEETWLVNVGSGDTPWEASTDAVAQIGDGYRVLWETLPWAERRVAYGIVLGIAELFCATGNAQRAIYEARLTQRATAVEAAKQSAADASRMIARAVDTRDAESLASAEAALVIASRWLPGYGPALRLVRVALTRGHSGSRRSTRLVRRAERSVLSANNWHGIDPISS